ncbi:MAG: M16 family metallopeptidase [Paracoccaceae bacterium]
MMRFLFVLYCVFATQVWAATDIQTLRSPAGVTAWLVEDRNIPFVALEMRFKGGSAIDPADKSGATNLMMALLEEGSGEMDAQAFTTAKETLAANFSYDSYQDAVTVSARFLTENREEALSLLRQSIVSPRFEDSALERVRNQVMTGLRSSGKDPEDILRSAFNSEAYGAHPYARDDSGTFETVTALTREDMFETHRNALVKDRVYIAAVGDISADELGLLIDRLLDGLPETSARTLPKEADLGLQRGVKVIDFPVPQSVALFGHVGIARDDPDFFAAYLLNQIFGGTGFESRLMTEVREKRGLTYGISTFLASREYAQTVVGQFASANDKMAEALNVLRAEWSKMAQQGVSADELQRVKTYLTGAYPLRFDGNAAIAGILVGMQMQGLDPSYVVTRNDKVNAVTLEQANRVAKRLFQPESLRIFVVGQPEGL